MTNLNAWRGVTSRDVPTPGVEVPGRTRGVVFLGFLNRPPSDPPRPSVSIRRGVDVSDESLLHHSPFSQIVGLKAGGTRGRPVEERPVPIRQKSTVHGPGHDPSLGRTRRDKLPPPSTPTLLFRKSVSVSL